LRAAADEAGSEFREKWCRAIADAKPSALEEIRRIPTFRASSEAAGLNPVKVTMYALWHPNIVRQILGGVPFRVVAVNHDTGVGIWKGLQALYRRPCPPLRFSTPRNAGPKCHCTPDTFLRRNQKICSGTPGAGRVPPSSPPKSTM
jgi:hypothetical protein